jgi:GT2 family glycosyltransferase
MSLTSIVIPCHDNLLYTALCLESIARHTPEPHEVVVVDNGCTDATAEWSAARGARVVRSPFNRGFAGGANLGLAAGLARRPARSARPRGARRHRRAALQLGLRRSDHPLAAVRGGALGGARPLRRGPRA